MITARSTRLVRVPDLRTFRDALAALACEGDPLEARDRLLVVPTRAAAAQLTRTIEDRCLPVRGAAVLPVVVTRDGLYERLAGRLGARPRLLTQFEREALMRAACRAAAEGPNPPPFRLRPGLIVEILSFYDGLRRHEKDVETFRRTALSILEPGADTDRGAERLVRQTRFLADACTAFEARCAETGALDEHGLRALLRAAPAGRPYRHAIVSVRDRACDPHGLWTCDFDLLARLPALERIDVVVTDTRLAGSFHERIHALLPGIEEHRWPPAAAGRGPVLAVPPASARPATPAHVTRDREEEVADFAVRVRRIVRDLPDLPLERVALVVHRPLPYVYLARDVLRSAAVPVQMFDALPLAAEPYAAALDLVFAAVSSNFARVPLVALLASPHFRFVQHGRVLRPADAAVLDRALAEGGYLGDVAALDRIGDRWPIALAADVAKALAVVREPRPIADQLGTVIEFIERFDAPPQPDDPWRSRQLRARAAILGALRAIQAAHAAHDGAVEEFEAVAAIVRRWIESHTFSPRAGDAGVHLVDADSAPYGDFDVVQLAGLVEGEWPDRPGRSIFYSANVLQHLGWTTEAVRLEGARSAFADLLRLPSARLFVSTFTLEDDGVVSPSPLLEEVGRAGLEEAAEDERPRPRVFEWEALGLEPVRVERLDPAAAERARFRIAAPPVRGRRHQGVTSGHAAAAFSVSALERYQDCPFKFFAADVLRLQEAPEDEPALSPKARGRFVHEVFQRFFEAWDRDEGGTIDPDRFEAARAKFEAVAEPLLAALSPAEAALERARLFGSAIAPGIAEVVLGLEASRQANVVERWLEYRLEGEFSLGGADGRRASLRGVADRVDLLEGRRLRVIDYKTGSAPNVKRALQVPVYALCAIERLEARDGEAWEVDEASYVAFTGRRALVPVVKASADPAPVLGAARARLFELLDGVTRGEFPPRPHDPIICSWCAYAPVCRKDYVGDE